MKYKEDECAKQIELQEPSNTPIQSVEKLENIGNGIEGKKNTSIATASILPTPSNYNVNLNSKSAYEESCNSVNSLTLPYQSNKKSEEIKADSFKKQKETNQIISDNIVKPIKVVNLDTIKYSLQLIGFKYKDANQFCEILKNNYRETIAQQSKECQDLQEAFGKFKMARAYLHTSQLYKGIVDFAQSNDYIKIQKENSPSKLIQYFDMCVQILQKKYPLIILLGGTSGTGKSTLSSILSSRFQIPTVLSSDSIRHIIRNFMDESEEPILFTSTYEAGKILKDDTITKESKKTIQGYKIQCKLVQQKLEDVISQYAKKGEPMIIEGVHLTPRFMFSMMKKYPYVIPFTICIEKESKHRQRFAVRSKYMTLDKKKNKYIQYISNIRMIQAWFMEKSDEHLIPKINNVNIDKSINIIHRVVTAYMRKMINENMSIIPEKSINALKLYRSFNKIIKPHINKLQVEQEVNKDLIMQKFLESVDQELNENENNNSNINSNYTNKSNNSNYSNSIQDDLFQNSSQFNLNNDIKIVLQNPNKKASSSNLSLENIIINRNTSPSIDLLNIDQGNNILNNNYNMIENGIQNIDLLSIQQNKQMLSNPNSIPSQNISTDIPNNQQNSSKDPNLLLNQFLNDLENKHPRSFVEYTIKKIEDMQQNVLKIFEQKPLNNITDLSISNTQNLSNKINQIEQNQLKSLLNNLTNGTPDQNLIHQMNNIIMNDEKIDLQKQCPISSTENKNIFQNNQNIINNENPTQNGKNDDNQLINGSCHDQSQEQQLNKEDKNNNEYIISNNQNQLINNINQNNIQNPTQIEVKEQNLQKMNSLDQNKQTKRKKKIKMDEKSNQVTIHSSSHNEEQTNTEQQSEGDSLLMGEDNYQFDVLSEGEEGEEDLDNHEEHSNSIDDEEEADYNDNFGNQSDESSDYDEEIKDDQYAYDEDEEYYDDDDDEEDEQQENELNRENFVCKLGDVVHELDPQQIKNLDYEGYQHYIKSIKEIVEATVNQQKLKDKQKGLYAQSQRKKLHQSKSQLFNSEEEGKVSDKIENSRKQRQRAGKSERQFSYFRKYEGSTPQQGSSANSMTWSVNLSKKRSSKQNRGMRKTLNNYNLVIQKQDISISNQDSCSTPTDNRAKSCDPEKSNLVQKKLKKNNKQAFSRFKEEMNKQIQEQQNEQIEIKLIQQENSKMSDYN